MYQESQPRDGPMMGRCQFAFLSLFSCGESFWTGYCCILFVGSAALVPRIKDLGRLQWPDMRIVVNLQLPAI